MSTSDEDRALLPFEGEGGSGRLIRRQWHDGRWFFSVVDVVAALTDNDTPRRYWSDLKRKLRAEGFESYDKIVQLKMRSLDGKNYATDAADTETMLRIVQSVPSPRAEPIKQWLAHEGARRLEEVAATLDEDQRRLFLRGEVADKNQQLSGTVAEAAGITSNRDFGIFQDFGYRGLYAGETARDIAARKGLAKGERILDWMGSTELAANWFRITQTDDLLRRDTASLGITGKARANATHHAVGREVRETIKRLGGTMPEDLPTPAQSIQQIQHAEQQRVEAERQPSLFPPDGETEGGGN